MTSEVVHCFMKFNLNISRIWHIMGCPESEVRLPDVARHISGPHGVYVLTTGDQES